jgi:hypothetical protein
LEVCAAFRCISLSAIVVQYPLLRSFLRLLSFCSSVFSTYCRILGRTAGCSEAGNGESEPWGGGGEGLLKP